MASKKVTVSIPPSFADFDLSFRANPVTGDLIMRKDTDAIKRSVKNLVFTYYYERPFQPQLGNRIPKLLFDLADPTTIVAVKQAIFEVLRNYEPRIVVEEILANFNTDQNGCNVSIFFSIVGGGSDSISFFLRRVH